MSAAGQSRADAAVVVQEAGARLRLTTDPNTPTELCIRIDRDERTRTIELSLKPMTDANTIEVGPASTQRSAAHDGWASRISTSTYALSVSTLSFLATGVALGVRGRRELDQLQQRCGELSCGHGDATRGRRLYVAADVMLGLSAGLSLASLWSYFVGDRESDQRSFAHSRAPNHASTETARSAPLTGSFARAPERVLRHLPSLSLGSQHGMLAWSARF